jgi:undecaprenyl-diphosphatase
MYALDAAITHWINSWAGRNSALDFLMISISTVGVPVLVLAVACQWWVPSRDQSMRHVLVAAGSSFVLGLALNQLILMFVHRVRPYDNGVTSIL